MPALAESAEKSEFDHQHADSRHRGARVFDPRSGGWWSAGGVDVIAPGGLMDRPAPGRLPEHVAAVSPDALRGTRGRD
jgi:hypothetical protein